MSNPTRTICWQPLWSRRHEGVGLEHLLLGERTADSTVVAIDDALGPFRLSYYLRWDESWRLREAELTVRSDARTGSLHLETDGRGAWRHARGDGIPELSGCLDIDIWPTPFTNWFPIRREAMATGERREFRMAWIHGPDLTFSAQPQAYTRLADGSYLFESLDGTGFRANLRVDEQGIVVDYPGLFRRLRV